ncbi:LysR family transcriptional regulator [Methylobacterium durans]|jgi:DNA-binding transcriptional LysR family regulator|uniref:LysR family transcriptional regulator n=1 Tax=Methylobacterium durans TaxID=2202825 RepID=A0A2U8WBM9_9HYPH|nr:LysR family transcriptional regulator [Methylobacterium durans]AWN43001.1 LysR family transcriptional regulator [Methylobacterium durans]
MPQPQVLRDMALFVEVAKRKSFSQAAAALDMPISSVSRRITQFETAVGLRLLDRTTRKLALTPYGEAYLAQATRIVEEAQRTFDDMIAQAKGPTGFLKVAAPPDFWVLRHLSDIVCAFSEDHEHIHVHLDLRSSQVDLVREDYDLAIAMEEPRQSSLIVRRVVEVESALFASPAYLRARGRPKHPQDLAEHDVVLSVPGASDTWQFTRGDEIVSAPVSGRISCNNLSLARRLAVTGRGIAASNLVNVARDLDSGRLDRILPDWRLPPTSIYIVTTSRLLPAKTRRFIDFVSKRLAGVFSGASRGAERLPLPERGVPQPVCLVRP